MFRLWALGLILGGSWDLVGTVISTFIGFISYNSPRPRPKRSEVPIRIPSIPHLLIPFPLPPPPGPSWGGGGGGGVVCGRGAPKSWGLHPPPSPPPLPLLPPLPPSPPSPRCGCCHTLYLSIYLSIYLYIYIYISIVIVIYIVCLCTNPITLHPTDAAPRYPAKAKAPDLASCLPPNIRPGRGGRHAAFKLSTFIGVYK